MIQARLAVFAIITTLLLAAQGRSVQQKEPSVGKEEVTYGDQSIDKLYSLNKPQTGFDDDGFSHTGSHYVSDPSAKSVFFKQVEDMTWIVEPNITDDEGRRVKRNALIPHPFGSTLWPNGLVPYEIAPAFNDEERRIILQGMRHWEEKTCIRFRPRVSSDVYYVLIMSGQRGNCRSFIGRLHRNFQPQGLTLGDNCVRFSTVVHELGHAIGFYHEHNRVDRDEYVTVISGNIHPSVTNAFQKNTASNANTLGLGYDYASIMHYSSRAFSKDGRSETIRANYPNIPIGEAQELSPLDIEKTKRLYQCPPPSSRPPLSTVVPPVTSIQRPPGVSCGTVETLRGLQAKTVQSPFYPAHRNNQRCAWVFTCPKGYTPQTEFPGLQLEESSGCAKDYAQIYFGASLDSGAIVRYGGLSDGRICSSRYARTQFFVSTQTITVLYRTDGSGGSRGLQVRVTCIDDNECRTDKCHTCTNTVGSFDCQCNEGYYLSPAANTCYDINECAYNNGDCQHKCVNMGGSYKCECPSGQFLQADGQSCGSTRPGSGQTLCPALSHPTNGAVSVTRRTVGGTASYSCNSGYSLVGSSSRSCQSSGSWSGSAPTCQRQCPTLSSPSNGRVSTNTRNVGGIATYSCNIGYNLVGSRTRTCQSTGTWSGQPPTCPREQQCTTPTFMLRGRTYQNNANVVMSDIGEGDNALKCMTDKTDCCKTSKEGECYYPDGTAIGWSATSPLYRTRDVRAVLLNRRNNPLSPLGRYRCDIPDCRGVTQSIYINIIAATQCPTLTSPSSGRVSVSSTSVGGTATYSCNSGYSLIGSAIRRCQSSGSWSGSAPICQRNQVLCPTLSSPSNGRVSINTRNVGGTATYSCNFGYSLAGSSTRRCQSSGIWSGSAPTCQRQCPTLSSPPNGRISINTRNVGGTATYSCNSGYSLVGSSPRTCQSSGIWSGSAPTCQQQGPTVSFMLRGKTYQNNANVEMNDIGVGNNALLCKTDRTSCCGTSKEGEFYYPDGTTVGWSATNSLFRDRGSQVVRLNRRNNPLSPLGRYRCDIPDSRGVTQSIYINIIAATQCPTLTSPSNGGVSVSSTDVGGTATYSCSPGYNLAGSRTRTCQSDGTWSGQPPTCQCRPCSPLFNAGNLRVSVSSFCPGGIATYSCVSGFSVVGSSTRTCGTDGRWIGVAPTCRQDQLLCPDLPNPPNGDVTITRLTAGGIARYSCSTGYLLNGVVVRVCGSTGVWSGSAPTCQRQCPIIFSPTNGRITTTSRNVGGTATYSCNSGYTLVGSSTRSCQSSGSWSGSAPTCLRQCSTLSSPSNGRVSINTRNVGGTATYSCNSGYSLVGSSTRRCQSSAIWSGSAPTCQQGTSLKFVVNGQTYPNNSNVLMSAIGEGVNALKCMTDKTDCCKTSKEGEFYYPDGTAVGWSATNSLYRTRDTQAVLLNRRNNALSPLGRYCCDIPDSRGVKRRIYINIIAAAQCPTLTSPSNGRVSVSSTSVGGTATYSCNSGYSLVGSSTRRCQSSGSWSGSAPICQRNQVLCSTLSSPSNGRVSINTRNVGGTATYSCNSGYSLVGSSTRSCQSSGIWSGSAPTCLRQCPTLSSPSNGRVIVSSRNVGGTATYSCNSGYSLAGPSPRSCQSSGSWSGSAPTCQRDQVLCPALPNPSNGRVSINTRNVGGTATYSCNSGYSLVGSSSRTCQSSGSWSGSAPTCQRQCPTLSSPSNGRVIVSSRNVGGIATYSCNSGYSLAGSSPRSCQSSGIWSGSAPTCQQGTNLKFTLGGKTYQNNSIVQMTDIGEGDNALKCMTDKIDCCRTSKEGEFYYPDGTPIGWSATDPLYRSRGPQTNCLNRRNNLLSPLGRYCCAIPDSRGVTQRIYITVVADTQCPTLTSPSNGRVSVSSTSVGGTATYSCPPGYFMVGSRTRTCQSDGTWSGQPPTCQCRPCSPLFNAGNLRVSVPSRCPGDTATYFCVSGFSVVGSSTRTCGTDGRWGGVAPTCRQDQLLCPDLPDPRNGDVTVTRLTAGGVARYSCSTGYLLNGFGIRVCGSTGVWSGSAPTCQRQCPIIFSPTNGRITITSRNVGGTATYSCNSGYSLVGSSPRTCLSDGSWSGSAPICQRDQVLCPALPNPSNGGVSINTRTVGGTATYSCNSRYSLVGSSTRRCQSSGSWSGSAPTCQQAQSTALKFMLRGQTYFNNAVVRMRDIGEGDNALMCKTDKTDCCRTSKEGEFYYPDGTAVGWSATNPLYRTRGPQGVYLNRRGNVLSPLGRYRCDIPDSRGVTQSIYINIV